MSRQHLRKQNTTKLPLALQKELGFQDGKDRGQDRRKRGSSAIADRKNRRKALRTDRKRNGNHFVQSNKNEAAENEGSVSSIDFEDEQIDEIDIKPGKLIPTIRSEEKVPSPPTKSILKKTRTEEHSSKAPTIQLAFGSDPESGSDLDFGSSRASSPGLVLDPNSKSFRQHAAEDDDEIAALERKLGLKTNGKGNVGDEFLDYVLGSLEEESGNKKRKGEAQDWLDGKRQKLASTGDDGVARGSRTKNDDGNGNFEIDDELNDEEESASSLDENDDEVFDELNSDNESLDVADSLSGSNLAKTDKGIPEPPVKRERENPYIAPVAPDTTPGKYIPPSMRMREKEGESGSEVLRRQLQGQLNKLTEANMISILGEIEKLYRTNSRQEVTMTLIDLILASFCVTSTLQNTFIILHAAFLAAVYKVVGTDFGVELLVRLVERFEQQFSRPDSGKEAVNLISLLTNLFTFNVLSSVIIFDHIHLLLRDLNELNAEILLRMVRDCGPQLRSDDPSALKNIVSTIQEIVTEKEKKGQSINMRTKVMIDTITDLKNNKTRKAASTAGATGEHITRMRKALGSLNNRSLKATEPLRISREDIANSDKKGKWWLVGASWKGNDQAEVRKQDRFKELMMPDDESVQAEDEIDLLSLAKQYQMNTDVRRSIFVAIMSATDHRDAQTRLVKLRLSTKQEQEVAKVLLRCARAEPAYNPYYGYLAKNLCKDNKKMRIGLQFGLWDFFGRMGERTNDDEDDDEQDNSTVEMHEIVNVAKMYGYLIYSGQLTIGILKTLNIGFLKEQAMMFLEILLIYIITQPKATEEDLMKIFSKAADTPQVVKGLRYFVKKYIRKSDLITKREKEKVKAGCHVADIAFGMIDSAGRTDIGTN